MKLKKKERVTSGEEQFCTSNNTSIERDGHQYEYSFA